MIRSHYPITEFLDRTFSSMCFGGIFGCWLLVTGVLLFIRGIFVVVASVALYLVAAVAVLLLPMSDANPGERS